MANDTLLTIYPSFIKILWKLGLALILMVGFVVNLVFSNSSIFSVFMLVLIAADIAFIFILARSVLRPMLSVKVDKIIIYPILQPSLKKPVEIFISEISNYAYTNEGDKSDTFFLRFEKEGKTDEISLTKQNTRNYNQSTEKLKSRLDEILHSTIPNLE